MRQSGEDGNLNGIDLGTKIRDFSADRVTSNDGLRDVLAGDGARLHDIGIELAMPRLKGPCVRFL